jgi:hypothetical protein
MTHYHVSADPEKRQENITMLTQMVKDLQIKRDRLDSHILFVTDLRNRIRDDVKFEQDIVIINED